jgi:hypothetical protein
VSERKRVNAVNRAAPLQWVKVPHR